MIFGYRPGFPDVQYAPHGAPSQYRYGNNLLRSVTYNNRLQTATMKDTAQDIALWDASLNYGAANNNGNLQSETTVHSVGGPPGNPRYSLTLQATYGYDSLNRLTNVASTGFNIRYGYDAWNNMWVPEPPAFSANGLTPRDNLYEATNRMRGATYDSAGNLQSYGTKSIVYDAENKQSTVTESAAAGGGQVSYAYDGDGRRVMKTINADSSVYVYDIFGHLAAEYTNYSAPEPPCTTCYLSVDHLGSTRLVTDAAANVISRHDYLPFGEEIPAGPGGRTSEWASTTDVRQKFTGQERDKETGLDYFGARYMSSAQGRFMSPDEPLIDQHTQDPQSWNLYSYVRNNPLKNIDPLGEDCIATSNQTSSGVTVATERGGSAQTCSGTYVDGTVNTNSYQYNGRNLDYSFANDSASGAGTISFGSSQSDWGPGSSNMLGARQIGMTAPIGEALGYATGGVMLGAGAGIAYGAYAGGTGLIGLGIGSTPAPAVIFRAQQLTHALRSEPGHNRPLGTPEEIKTAVTAAFKAGSYSVSTGGVVKGTTYIQGVAHEFTGFLRTAGEMVFSNIYRK